MEWNWTCPRVTLPSHRFCRPSGSLAPSGTKIGQVRGTCTHPAGFTGLNAAGYIITWLKWILRPESHRHRLLYERSAFLALPRRNETGAPARTCTSNLRLRTAACRALTPRELMKTFASCRCCPGPSGLEDRHARCYINDAGLLPSARTG